MKILPRSFYERDTVKVAKDLIGKCINRQLEDQTLIGIITEVEAYRFDDPASHAFRGKTISNRAMFEEVGHAYIYFIYGNHYCLNVVARDEKHTAGGVLIRALKPIEGIDMMLKNRKVDNVAKLTDGPGKLAQALKINKELYGIDLTKSGPLYVTEGINIKKSQIISSVRIGIKKAIDKKWRFYCEI